MWFTVLIVKKYLLNVWDIYGIVVVVHCQVFMSKVVVVCSFVTYHVSSLLLVSVCLVKAPGIY